MSWTSRSWPYASMLAVTALLIIQLGCSKTPPPSELKPLGEIKEPPPVGADEFCQFAENGRIDEVVTALRRGIDVHSLNADGRTALMLGAFNGHTKVVEVLLKNGARVDDKDPNGRTALQFAASGPYARTVEVLLENGAEVDVEDSVEHFTALMFAAGEGHEDVVEVLLKHGADPTIKDVDGDTALSFAIQRNQQAVIALLKAQETGPSERPETAAADDSP
jgi:ankyrin repeat protein